MPEQGRRFAVDQGGRGGVGDVGQGQGEEVLGLGGQGREEPVEEQGVQDRCGRSASVVVCDYMRRLASCRLSHLSQRP